MPEGTDNSLDVAAIFERASELETKQRRDEYLDEACQGDALARAEIESMLIARHEQGEFLADPTMDGQANLEASEGASIGPYTLLQQIGEGGMGVVFMAEQVEPVRRRVAIKIMKFGIDNRQVIARFEAERQALALMDHPNIARVLDGGKTQQGRPYFVMELVRGVPITRYCDENQLPTRQRLELFAQVCSGIEHAHQKGIIHRDIKPTNVLIAEYDDRPTPKIIDFGIAKAVGRDLVETRMFTRFGQILGTLEYMSPEQAKLNQWDIDTRSDIYSLGVLLYELLTGNTPFDKKRLKEAALDEILRIIREEEPIPPSTLVTTCSTLPEIAGKRRVDAKKLAPLIRGELDWIVMMSLDKDRRRRYQTAHALALDIKNHLNNDSVSACPPSVAYRVGKFAMKYRTLLATTGCVVLLLIASLAVTTSIARWAISEQEKAIAASAALRQEMKKTQDAIDERRIEAESARLALSLFAQLLSDGDGDGDRETSPTSFEHTAPGDVESLLESREDSISPPARGFARMFLAGMFRDHGNEQRAIENYEIALRLFRGEAVSTGVKDALKQLLLLDTDKERSQDYFDQLQPMLESIDDVYYVARLTDHLAKTGHADSGLRIGLHGLELLESRGESDLRRHSGWLRRHIAACYLAKNKHERAIKHLQDSAESFAARGEEYEQAGSLHAMALALSKASRDNEAIEVMKRAFEIDPGDKALPERHLNRQFWILIDLAKLYDRLGRTEHAIAYAQAHLATIQAGNPSQVRLARTHRLLGMYFGYLKLFAEAAEHYELAAQLHSQLGDKYFELLAQTYHGRFLELDGEPSEAEESHRKVYEAGRQHSDDRCRARAGVALNDLAKLHRRHGNLNLASRFARASTELLRKTTEGRDTKLSIDALFHQAGILKLSGQTEEAIAVTHEAYRAFELPLAERPKVGKLNELLFRLHCRLTLGERIPLQELRSSIKNATEMASTALDLYSIHWIKGRGLLAHNEVATAREAFITALRLADAESREYSWRCEQDLIALDREQGNHDGAAASIRNAIKERDGERGGLDEIERRFLQIQLAEVLCDAKGFRTAKEEFLEPSDQLLENIFVGASAKARICRIAHRIFVGLEEDEEASIWLDKAERFASAVSHDILEF